jgi:hypothetical protein
VANIELPPSPSGVLPRQELLRLAGHSGGLHVSIYLPTARSGPRTRENPIRLKNLLHKAEEALIAGGIRPTEARGLLEPAHRLEEDYDFWQHQSEGLCLHIAPGIFRQHRLPLQFDELAVVSERFHVRPLLELFTADASFYVLAISMNEVRVFRCGRYSEQELSVVEMPRGMDDALWPDDPEKQRQFRAMRSAQGGETALFYNSEDAQEQLKEQLFRYFRQVDQSLHHLLRNESAPLVVAAVDYLHPIYADANSYSNLLQDGVMGNPEGVHPDELRAKAWELVEPLLQRERLRALERFGSLQGTGRTSSDIGEILRETAKGRVDILFVAHAAVVWARVSPDGQAFEPHAAAEPGDRDLVDLAAVQTLTHGGRIYQLGRTKCRRQARLLRFFDTEGSNGTDQMDETTAAHRLQELRCGVPHRARVGRARPTDAPAPSRRLLLPALRRESRRSAGA